MFSDFMERNPKSKKKRIPYKSTIKKLLIEIDKITSQLSAKSSSRFLNFSELSSDEILDIINEEYHKAVELDKLLNVKITRFSFDMPRKEAYYAINEKNLELLSNVLNDFEFDKKELHGSDEDFINVITHKGEIDKIEFIFVNKNISQEGGYFKYINTTHYDLSILQIYTEEQIKRKKKIENCLIHSMRVLGVSEEKIEKCKIFVGNFTKKRDLPKIAKAIETNIECINLETRNRNRTYTYSGKSKEKIKIGLVDSHYFPIVDIWDSKTGKNRKSHILLKKLIKKNSFVKSHLMDKFYQQPLEQSLESLGNDFRHLRNKKNKGLKKIFYADFEALTNGKHKAFLLGVSFIHEREKRYRCFSNSPSELDENKAFTRMLKFIFELDLDQKIII